MSSPGSGGKSQDGAVGDEHPCTREFNGHGEENTTKVDELHLVVLTEAQNSHQAGIKGLAGNIKSGVHRCQDLLGNASHVQSLMRDVRDSTKWLMASVPAESKVAHKELLQTLDTLERGDVKFAMDICEQGINCKDLIQTISTISTRTDKLFNLSGTGDKVAARYSSTPMATELETLGEITMLIKKGHSELHIKADQGMDEALMTIQKAEQEIFRSDTYKEAMEMHQKIQQFHQSRIEIQLKRGAEEAHVSIAEAECEALQRRSTAAEDAVASLQQELNDKTQELQQLKAKRTVTKEECLAQCKRRQQDADAQLEKLRKMSEEELAKGKDQLESCEKKAAELEQKLLDLDSFNINHIILALDMSASMHEKRWKALLAALECFKNARLAKGALDKVSIVCFNNVASIIVQSASVASDFIADVRKLKPDGGTAYVAAWTKIEECAQKGPTGARIFAVFLTDGLAADIDGASTIAGRMFTNMTANKLHMNTFAVIVDDDVEEAVLLPLVKAANGGQDQLEICGETVPLAVKVKTSGLATKFGQLANLVSYQRCVLEARLGLVKSREQQHKDDIDKTREESSRRYNLQLNAMKQAVAAAHETASTDVTAAQRLYDQLIQDTENDVESLRQRLDTAEQSRDEVKLCLAEVRTTLKHQKKSFQDTEAQSNQEMQALSDMHTTHINELSSIAKKQRDLQDQAGTADFERQQRQLTQLSDLKQLLIRKRMLRQEVCNTLGSVVRYSSSFKQQIHEPLPGGATHIAKAKLVFGLLLKDRCLKSKGVAVEDMKLLLKCEADLQNVDGDEALKTIISRGVDAEMLCKAVDKEGEEVETSIQEVVEMIEKFGFQQEGVDLPKVESMQKELREKKKALKEAKAACTQVQAEVKQLEAKTKLAPKARVADEEASDSDDGWEVLDDKKGELDGMQNAVKELENAAKDLQTDINDASKEIESVRKQLQPTTRLVKVTMGLCRQAYLEYMALEEKAALTSVFAAYKENVRDSMCSFIESAGFLRDEICNTQLGLASTPFSSAGSNGGRIGYLHD
eukprot:TRINITY_DN23128_c0_g2_i1.p1 TRINITY_DN23128_c0_g2~~TRINITY_DN23128_c0_g2_i1.p1  ORF type:complete len:1037 (-),score=262.72 TRINITY_DN23128_c0_g2_i1:387-3497(-)